jgi:hypothetical protein
MFDRGKLAVLAMLALALAAAAFAWWWNVQSKRQSLAFFGPEAARLIGKAPKVELVSVELDAETPAMPRGSDEHISIGDQHFTVRSRHDVSQAQGLIHARTALLDDASFEWQSPPGEDSPELVVVRFADAGRQTLVALDCPNRQLIRCDTGAKVRLNPKISAGWQQFIARHVSSNTTASGPSENP